jgi:hypothetical protein
VRRLPALPPGERVSSVERWTDDYARLWQGVREQFTCSVDKTAQYMTWRYLSAPMAAPLCVGLQDGAGRLTALAVAVLHTERDPAGRPCAVHAEITELIADPPDDPRVRTLLLHLMHELDRLRVDSITATGLQACYHALLASVGFEHERSDALCMAVNLGSREATSRVVNAASPWYVSAGDGEALFAPAL